MVPQGARRHYAQEMRIKIDYSDLPDSLKRFKEQDAIRKKTEEIHRECINLRASLEKYVGADLKASDRLKDVEDRLRTASDDMDTARKEFNKKKRAFDVVAKTRYEHVCVCVCVCVYTYVCAHVCTYVCVCVCVYVYVCVCGCVYVYVCVRVCVSVLCNAIYFLLDVIAFKSLLIMWLMLLMILTRNCQIIQELLHRYT